MEGIPRCQARGKDATSRKGQRARGGGKTTGPQVQGKGKIKNAHWARSKDGGVNVPRFCDFNDVDSADLDVLMSPSPGATDQSDDDGDVDQAPFQVFMAQKTLFIAKEVPSSLSFVPGAQVFTAFPDTACQATVMGLAQWRLWEPRAVVDQDAAVERFRFGIGPIMNTMLSAWIPKTLLSETTPCHLWIRSGVANIEQLPFLLSRLLFEDLQAQLDIAHGKLHIRSRHRDFHIPMLEHEGHLAIRVSPKSHHAASHGRCRGVPGGGRGCRSDGRLGSVGTCSTSRTRSGDDSSSKPATAAATRPRTCLESGRCRSPSGEGWTQSKMPALSTRNPGQSTHDCEVA